MIPEVSSDFRSKFALVQESFTRAAKRIRNFSDSCQWTESEQCADLKKFVSITELSPDVFEYICEFLTAVDLVRLSQSCKNYHEVALSNVLWKRILIKKLEVQFNQNLSLCFQEPEYAQIYPYAEDFPLMFDLTPYQINRIFVFKEEKLNISRAGNDSGVMEVKFIGEIGNGNRCLKTDSPFPSTYIWNRISPGAHGSRNGISTHSLYMMYCLLRLANSPSPQNGAALAALSLLGATSTGYEIHSAATTPLPFCTPRVSDTGALILLPHLISYFEIEIIEDFNRNESSSYPDCIAIGLSSNSFSLDGKMPGWDSHSYGYHSDDGGVFHKAGSMLSRYGPTFGNGDIVGCGLDYTHGHGVTGDIFFTLNGKYLGIAFENIHADKLYPTVGIDTSSKIRINVGHSAPYKFNLHNFEKERIADALMRSKEESLAAEANWAARQQKAVALCPFIIGAAALPALAFSRADNF